MHELARMLSERPQLMAYDGSRQRSDTTLCTTLVKLSKQLEKMTPSSTIHCMAHGGTCMVVSMWAGP
jgi:hypothetical protein